MANIFVAMKLKAMAAAELARAATIQCFSLGLKPRDEDDDPTNKVAGHNAHSRHTVAQDKRGALKRRNVRRQRK